MSQPLMVKILDCSEKQHYNLPDEPVKCKIQDREIGDISKVVYVRNPGYTLDSETETAYIALCEGEYEVVEWN